MKRFFRIADLWIQGGLIWALICCVWFKNDAWYTWYYVTLCWYLVSIITHTIIAIPKYKWVYIMYLVLASSAVVCWFIGNWYIFLLGIAVYTIGYAGPVLVVFYITTCVLENRHLKKRPLSFLM